jgi:hypothetical protein
MSLLSTAARTVADWVKLGFPEEVAKRIVSGELPMDRASRMKRAEEQGYGDVLYHGSTHDIKEFKPSTEGKMGPGVYTSPMPLNKYADGEGGNILPVRVKGEHALRGDALEMYDDIPIVSGGSNSPEKIANNRLRMDRLRNDGYAGMEAPGAESVTFDPRDVRSANAAFDPQYKGANILGGADPRLLAGIAAGGGGVSAATAMLNQLAAAQAVKERGNIRAPNSGMLHGITMGARDLERRLEGHPAALLFPEGVVNYLEQLNREERPSRETALWALLDMI